MSHRNDCKSCRTATAAPLTLRRVHIAGQGSGYYDISLAEGRIASIVPSVISSGHSDLDSALNDSRTLHHDGAAKTHAEQTAACHAPDLLAELWVTSTLTDLHNHPGWTDFMEEDSRRRTFEEKRERILSCFRAMTRRGIGCIRDAGGFPPAVKSAVLREDASASAAIHSEAAAAQIPEGNSQDLTGAGSAEQPYLPCPAVIPCAGMLPQETLDTALSNHAPWVKIFATGGSGSDPDHVLDPLLDEETFAADVRAMHQAGKRVMVHTFGGMTLDWCIRYHVDTVEHGIYMTEAQAQQLAEQQIGYTATARIYELLADASNPLGVPSFIREHAAHTLEPHQRAIEYARSAGVCIGFGTDYYCDPACEGHILEELYALMNCGLTPAEAWQTGTQNAAAILGRSHTGAVREGYAADLIVFSQDPFQTTSAAALEASVFQVIRSGRTVHQNCT